MLYLRNPVEGHRTPKERVVDLLRDHVWQGEEITVLVRDLFYRDAYLATSSLATAPVKPPAESPSGPVPPLVSPAAFDRLLVPVDLEIGLDGGAAGRVAVGRWYPAQDNPGIFVTTLRPDLVSPEVIDGPEGPRCGPRSGRVRGPRLSRGLRPRAVRPRLSPGHRPPACRLVRHGPPGGPRRRLDGTGRHRDDRATGQDRDAEPDGGRAVSPRRSPVASSARTAPSGCPTWP